MAMAVSATSAPFGIARKAKGAERKAERKVERWKGKVGTSHGKLRVVRARALVDPWSISTETIVGQLFAASLFPYLGFLYWLTKPRKKTKVPGTSLFGFYFLLVFVFATIPAGIYAKVHYGEPLANVDWLHGTAESLLTITNLLVVLGFRNATREVEKKQQQTDGKQE